MRMRRLYQIQKLISKKRSKNVKKGGKREHKKVPSKCRQNHQGESVKKWKNKKKIKMKKKNFFN